MEYEGVSDADAKLINRHAKKVQTSVSLQALMRTGRGEFLHKTFDEESVAADDHTATELVLMQVRSLSLEEVDEIPIAVSVSG